MKKTLLFVAVCTVISTALRADTTIPTFLRLNFANTSTYADSDVYFLFSTAQSQGGSGNLSGTILSGGSYSAATLDATFSAGGQYWSLGNEYSGADPTYAGRNIGYTLEQLKNGVDLLYADSVTIYVSLGAPMYLNAGTGAGATHQSISTFGTPSLTAGNPDPNFYVRWQPFEITRTSTYTSSLSHNGIPGDYGNVTAINAYAVPIQIQNFTGANITNPSQANNVQTVTTTGNYINGTFSGPDGQTLTSTLLGLANANVGNNETSYPGVATNWYVTSGGTDGSGNFLRMLGPSSGANGAFSSQTWNGQSGTDGAFVAMSSGFGGGTFFTNVSPVATSTSGPPAAGQTNPVSPASSGPYPSFEEYVAYVGTGNSGLSFQTPLAFQYLNNGGTTWAYSATTSVVAFSGGTYTATWQNRLGNDGAISGSNTGSMIMSSTGYAIQITGSIYATGAYNGVSTATTGGSYVGSFVITMPPDQTGTLAPGGTVSPLGFIQTTALYGSVLSTPGNIFAYTDLTGDNAFLTGTYLSVKDLPHDYAIWSQVIHDMSVGYNLGLIASSATIAGYAAGTSVNDMGSPGWTEFKSIYTSGTYTGSGVLPVYQAAWGGTATGYYNQYSEYIYNVSESVYGNAYSDFSQPIAVNANSAPITSEAITSWTITILPDVIPEVSTWALLLVGGGLTYAVRRRRKTGADV